MGDYTRELESHGVESKTITEYTRDYILSMPVGRELDELVIREVMGIKVVPQGTIFWDKKDAPFPFAMLQNNEEGWRLYEDHDIDYWGYRCFNPSEDISVAWEALNWTGKAFQITTYGEGYEVTLQWESDRIPRFRQVKYISKSAPEAISKAALLAVMRL